MDDSFSSSGLPSLGLSAPALSPATSGIILIVDDNPSNLHLLSAVLTKEGYDVRKALSGSMALQVALNAPPDLMLLDIMMPDMDGYSVCQLFKEQPNLAEIPIIFLSALDEAFDKVRAFRTGGADYITKPFQLEEVLARVQHQLALRFTDLRLRDLNLQLEARVQERTRQLALANQRLQYRALHDGLTNLSNRSCFMEQLTQALAQKPPAGTLAVLFLDCDRFKVINDSLGHAAGDQVLQAIAQRLHPLLSQVTLLSRFGGDEFTILMDDLSDPTQAVTIAETVLSAMQEPFALGNRHLFVGASIGIAYNQSNDCQPEELLRDADTAMYRAKAAGKGCYCIFEPAMHDNARARLQLETDLRVAIDRQEFQLRYQPIINLTTGALAGFEVLLRWHHPARGIVSPDLFLDVAEETSLITHIDQQTLGKACRQLRQWQRDGIVDPRVTISVNLSAQQFGQPGLVELVDDLLQAADLSPQNLNLEVTETSILTDVALTQAVLKTLQSRQIGISIDDFGTGYSSLSYLHAFCFNTLKIDQSFVQSLTPIPTSTGLIPLILSVAKTLDATVIAEGIEYDYQLEQIQAFGCDYGQGYYMSRPLAAEAVPAFVAAGNYLTPSQTVLYG